MLKQFSEVKELTWRMPPKNSGGSSKFPGGHKVIHRTAQTAFVRVVTPRKITYSVPIDKLEFCTFTHDRKAETLSFLKQGLEEVSGDL